jgi:7-cyano-7-deazaguanine synthase
MINWGKHVKAVWEKAELHRSGNMPSILVVLSGGMDSATCLGLAKHASVGGKIHAITFEYGQKHSNETEHALKIAKHFDIGCTVINLPGLADNFKTSLSKTSNQEIPDSHAGGVPNTYVPFRNTIMLSIAAGYAQSWGYNTIFYGANIVDYSGYPDCRPEYIDAMNAVLITHDHIHIEAPIVHLTKTDVVRLGEKLKVPWELTWSCYRGGDVPCLNCPSCQYRKMGFDGAQVKDPIIP